MTASMALAWALSAAAGAGHWDSRKAFVVMLLDQADRSLERAASLPETGATVLRRAVRSRALDACARAASASFEEMALERELTVQLMDRLVCVAGMKRTVEPCSALQARSESSEEAVTPREECEYRASKRLFVAALAERLGPSACSSMPALFKEMKAGERQTLCRALLAPGDDRAACSAARRRLGAGAKESRSCLAFRALASDSRDCAGLPEGYAESCHERLAWAGACPEEPLSEARCALHATRAVRGEPADARADQLDRAEELLSQARAALAGFLPRERPGRPELEERLSGAAARARDAWGRSEGRARR
jgi:hypothetical protein